MPKRSPRISLPSPLKIDIAQPVQLVVNMIETDRFNARKIAQSEITDEQVELYRRAHGLLLRRIFQ
jgi:hypothetical protein